MGTIRHLGKCRAVQLLWLCSSLLPVFFTRLLLADGNMVFHPLGNLQNLPGLPNLLDLVDARQLCRRHCKLIGRGTTTTYTILVLCAFVALAVSAATLAPAVTAAADGLNVDVVFKVLQLKTPTHPYTHFPSEHYPFNFLAPRLAKSTSQNAG